MRKLLFCQILLCLLSIPLFAQSIDDTFAKKTMQSDLKIFKKIRAAANSGLYKYRTKTQIDSIYQWAEQAIEESSTYLDFYNIICQLTDFEGSAHNATRLAAKYKENLRREESGYFPYPIKWIAGKWIVNFENEAIPVGAEILKINGVPIEEIILNLYKYHTTDGVNSTGKRTGIRSGFSINYRFRYGRHEEYVVTYKTHEDNSVKDKTLNSVSYASYWKNFNKRFSKSFDQIYYADLKENEKYKYEQINASTGHLTIYTFSMGNEKSATHKRYLAFLDSTFNSIKLANIENLIVDVRNNSGGTDPNDLVTYSYLTNRTFQENTQAWISFNKIPYLKYAYTKIPRFLRPIGVVFTGYNRNFRKQFPVEKDGNYFQDETSDDRQIRKPRDNAFTGNIYLLINPEVASAASLFAAMVAGIENTTVIGEETVGGYFGHNGHTPLGYILPESKIETFFSVVNLEQDVPRKSNQKYNRGIIPDYKVSQSHKDYLQHEDTQLEFVLEKLKEKL